MNNRVLDPIQLKLCQTVILGNSAWMCKFCIWNYITQMKTCGCKSATANEKIKQGTYSQIANGCKASLWYILNI